MLRKLHNAVFRELVPFERIRYTDSFDDPNLPGETQTTVTLAQLAKLVEQEIPG
ncbi:MAG: SRPBCC domain-containing protein [Gemmatimonadaceae bacterium]